MRRLLLGLAAAQVALGAARLYELDRDLLRSPSTLSRLGSEGALSSALPMAVLVAVSALWATLGRDEDDPFLARLGAACVAHLALFALVPYAAGLLLGRLYPWLGPGSVVVSAAVASALRRRRDEADRFSTGPFRERFGAFDAATLVVLLGLLVPLVFPYVHFDARTIWACRAFGFAGSGSLSGLASCQGPSYPPLFSILLWSGLSDPVLQGRLAPWLLLGAFALFLRGRLEPLLGRDAGAAVAVVVATGHVVAGTAMSYANPALMVFLGTGALLSLDLPAQDGRGRGAGARAAGALCLAAAVLVRPDGIVYAGVVAVAVGLRRVRGGPRLPLWPFAVAAAAWITWILRPASLRAAGGFLFHATDRWRTAGESTVAAIGNVLWVLLKGWQGQWLAHWGLGVAIPLLLGVAAWRFRRRSRGEGAGAAETGFLGLVSLGSLAAVVLTYLLVPFTSDPVAGVQPYETTEYLACWRNFVRVGLGRMTIHLLPFYALFVASALRDARGEAVARR